MLMTTLESLRQISMALKHKEDRRTEPAMWKVGWIGQPHLIIPTFFFLSSVRYARIGPYVQGATNIFRCPADKYVSSLQKSRGWFQRARSISLNAGIGEGNAESGPWDSLYRHIRKIYEFRYPVPAETLTFLDEHPDSINDPAFYPPHVNSWVDIPATYHDGAAGVTFADGHVEMHRWTGSLLGSALVRYAFAPVPTVAGDSDLHWISYHSPRISTNMY